MCKFSFCFFFFGFISSFIFPSPFFLGWGAAPRPLPRLPNPPPTSPRPKPRVQEGGALLCFDLLCVQCCEHAEEKRQLLTAAHTSLLCASPPLSPLQRRRRPAEGAQPPRWPPGGGQPPLCSAVVPRHCPDGRKTRQAPFFVCVCVGMISKQNKIMRKKNNSASYLRDCVTAARVKPFFL